MNNQTDKPTEWHSQLTKYTAARIGIGHAGISIPLGQSLQFKLAHAHARDAVHSQINIQQIGQQLQPLVTVSLHSCAATRHQYLQRPDLGRMLNEESGQALADYDNGYDICLIIADGLSATAVNQHSATLVNDLHQQLIIARFKVAPIILAEQARVAIADDIAFRLKAMLSVIIIGERPGLSAADSIGAYLTYRPQPGLTDDSRNCVSNIRPGGLSLKMAAQKLHYLIKEAFRLQLSGVNLKDDAALLY